MQGNWQPPVWNESQMCTCFARGDNRSAFWLRNGSLLVWETLIFNCILVSCVEGSMRGRSGLLLLPCSAPGCAGAGARGSCASCPLPFLLDPADPSGQATTSRTLFPIQGIVRPGQNLSAAPYNSVSRGEGAETDPSKHCVLLLPAVENFFFFPFKQVPWD